jgi:hypothetical protein
MKVNISRPVITIKEARKLLKADGAGLSDDEVLTLLNQIEWLADKTWSDLMVRKKGLVQ